MSDPEKKPSTEIPSKNPEEEAAEQYRAESSSNSDNSEEFEDPFPPETAMAATIGSLAEFDAAREKWEGYIERFEFFLEANKIESENAKRCTLFTAVGAKTYDTIKNLIAPETPGTVSYTQIKEKCKAHFCKSVNELLARVRFQKRYQKSGESLKDFERELRKLAQDCKFGGANASLPMKIMLRDRFVAGLADGELQRYLCRRHEESITPDNKDGLTLDKALEIGSSIEGTERLQKQLKSNESTSVKKLDSKKFNKKKNSTKERAEKENKPCYRCEKTNHVPDKCRFKKAICAFCNKEGHIEQACFFKKKGARPKEKSSKNARVVLSFSDSDSEVEYVHSITQHKRVHSTKSRYSIKVNLNGVEVNMEVDNGADESLINESTYKKVWRDSPPEWSSRVPNLKAWGKRPIGTKGTAMVSVEYKGIKKKLPVIVTAENEGPNLFGSNWFASFGIEVKGIHRVTDALTDYQLLLEEYPGTLRGDLSGHKGTPINIELRPGTSPKFFKSRRVPYGLVEPVNEALNEMVKQGMLSPTDQSDWATPALFVKKPNGEIRVVGYYKVTINPSIRDSEYLLPTVAEAMVSLNGGKFFSQIDLRNAYKQLRVNEETAKLLTISTPLGLFNVNVLLDGFNIAPRIFQKFMVSRLQGIGGILIYLDNIKIQGRTRAEHDQRLREVLKRLQDANLRINRGKCDLGVNSMEFLGYQISENGIQPLKSKIRAIQKMPAPLNVKELQVFLGGLNFYGRFLRDRATIAEPLHRLLDNDSKWNWTQEHESAFVGLKNQLITAPILCHFDEGRPIVVAADASPTGIGAILSNVGEDGEEHPVAFTSKTLSQTQRRYSQLDREALALVHAVRYFHQYIAGRKFKLVTDHKPLLGIFDPHRATPEILSPKQSRYSTILSAYDFEIEHRVGKKNGNVDVLSRLPLSDILEEEENKFGRS